MGERTRTRAIVVSRAIAARLRPRPATGEIRRVLVAHNLLLGDTLMLTPLMAKLRERHPAADIVLLAAPPVVPLYEKRPYGVRSLPFAPARSETTLALLEEAPFDLAIVPGDNRYSWLAAAMGARHIVVHAAPRSFPHEWFVDEKRAYGATPGAWGDLVADLIDGPAPRPYARGDWTAPTAAPFDAPRSPYAILHVGASTPLKHWPAERWLELANALAARGLQVAWSGGRGEEALVRNCDPAARYPSFAGKLDLAQMWTLLAGATLLVAPDTGIAHLGRAAWTPTVAIFGPGAPVLLGKGHFWRDTPWVSVAEDPFPCRDQHVLFDRHIDWVQRCGRTLEECPEPRCMQAVPVARVVAACDGLLAGQRQGSFSR